MDADHILERLHEQNPDALVLEDYKDALVGIVRTHKGNFVACYDADKCIDTIAKMEGVDDRVQAVEHFEFNVEGSYVGEHGPVFIYETICS